MVSNIPSKGSQDFRLMREIENSLLEVLDLDMGLAEIRAGSGLSDIENSLSEVLDVEAGLKEILPKGDHSRVIPASVHFDFSQRMAKSGISENRAQLNLYFAELSAMNPVRLLQFRKSRKFAMFTRGVDRAVRIEETWRALKETINLARGNIAVIQWVLSDQEESLCRVEQLVGRRAYANGRRFAGPANKVVKSLYDLVRDFEEFEQYTDVRHAVEVLEALIYRFVKSADPIGRKDIVKAQENIAAARSIVMTLRKEEISDTFHILASMLKDVFGGKIVGLGAVVAEVTAEDLVEIKNLFSDAIGVDLRAINLDGVALVGVRWSKETQWPDEWRRYVVRHSIVISDSDGVYEVTDSETSSGVSVSDCV